ncbi:MAG: rhodanese-like domain-containing protein [Paracoccaceae bacterium]
MSTGSHPSVGEVLPTDAWNILETEKDARLIDVRTQAEWSFVGIPDLSDLGQTLLCIEWASFPEMSKNPRFADAVTKALGGETPGKLMFLCRSGVRSLHAASAVADWYDRRDQEVDCLNVAGGFEGDLDAHGRRGIRNGWKQQGLAWRQS